MANVRLNTNLFSVELASTQKYPILSNWNLSSSEAPSTLRSTKAVITFRESLLQSVMNPPGTTYIPK